MVFYYDYYGILLNIYIELTTHSMNESKLNYFGSELSFFIFNKLPTNSISIQA